MCINHERSLMVLLGIPCSVAQVMLQIVALPAAVWILYARTECPRDWSVVMHLGQHSQAPYAALVFGWDWL